MPAMINLRREIPFPGHVFVEAGQNVEPGTLIAETVLQPAEPIHLPVTEIFNIPPNHVQNVMQVKVGDMVQSGQILAAGVFSDQAYELRSPSAGRIEQVSSLLGTISLRLEGDPNEEAYRVDVSKELGYPPLIARQYLQVKEGDKVQLGQLLAQDPDPENEGVAFAPITGEVIEIDGAVVVIQRPFVRTQVYAFLEGTVTEVSPPWGATIASTMKLHQGIFGLGGECYGRLRFLVNRESDVAEATAVGEGDRGKIVVAGALASLELLQRCREHGVVGVVAGGAHNLDLVTLLHAEIAPGMDTASLGLTLFLSEGMGRIAMEPSLFAALKRADGKTVSLNGLTQIRAGVIRPSIYLPSDSGQEENVGNAEGHTASLEVGSTIRIIREPWFGVLGTITALTGPDVLPSGIRALTYEIHTEHGDILRLARNNVEDHRV